jgi:hypothetical protein
MFMANPFTWIEKLCVDPQNVLGMFIQADGLPSAAADKSAA